MPVRAATALVATVIGVFLLFNFKTPNIVTAHPALAVPKGPTSSSESTPSPTPAGLRNGTFTGQDFPNEFGDVQVSVTIAGGRVTDVQALQLPMDRQRSAFISQQAGPLLHDEVLQAQSAQIDGVSGATYTSQSYAQSVQSALDQA